MVKRAIVLRRVRQYKAYNVNNLDRLNRVVTSQSCPLRVSRLRQ